MTEKLAHGEIAPGVFDSSLLPEFDKTQAVIKRAAYNLDYFTDPKSREPYGGAYWQVSSVDAHLMDDDEEVLSRNLYMPYLGGLEEVSYRVARDNLASLRQRLGDIEALDSVSATIDEQNRATRLRTLHKMGQYIVQRSGYYHVLVDTKPVGTVRIDGSFADLRGVAFDPDVDQKPVPVVVGLDNYPAAAKPVDGLYLYRG